MASWRLRQSYGFGAGRVPLAPVFTPGPFSAGDTLANDLAGLREELDSIDRRALVRRASGALALALAVTMTLVLVRPKPQERDLPVQDLVLIEPEQLQPEPEPEPEPVVEPEPHPVEVAKADPTPPPPPPPMAKPKPAPAPPPPPPPPVKRAEPVRPPPEPVKPEPVRPPPPKIKIDAIAKAPTPPPPAEPERVVRQAPPPKTPTFRMDPVAPSFAVAATAPPAGQAAPLRATPTREPVRKAPPVAFALGPVPAAPADFDPKPAAQVERAAPRAAPARSAPTAMPHFDPVAPPAERYAKAEPTAKQQAVERVVRTAAREETAAPAPKQAFQGVPLGSLAACVSDREEDGLKLQVMKAAGTRTSCSSRAGNYRFVETKNLNAFLMWIERNPSRKAADRCIELKLALACLAASANRRTDSG